MALVRIYFHQDAERMIQALMRGTIRVIKPTAPPIRQVMAARPPRKELEFRSLLYGRNIRTVLIEPGQVNKL